VGSAEFRERFELLRQIPKRLEFCELPIILQVSTRRSVMVVGLLRLVQYDANHFRHEGVHCSLDYVFGIMHRAVPWSRGLSHVLPLLRPGDADGLPTIVQGPAPTGVRSLHPLVGEAPVPPTASSTYPPGRGYSPADWLRPRRNWPAPKRIAPQDTIYLPPP